MGRNVVNIKCNIMPTEVIDLRLLKQQNEVTNQAALQFFEILSSQESIKRFFYFKINLNMGSFVKK